MTLINLLALMTSIVLGVLIFPAINFPNINLPDIKIFSIYCGKTQREAEGNLDRVHTARAPTFVYKILI